MMLIPLLFFFLLVVSVALVVRFMWDDGRTGHRTGGNRALDILDERFARGEVDQKEYEERRRILAGGR